MLCKKINIPTQKIQLNFDLEKNKNDIYKDILNQVIILFINTYEK